MYETSTKPPKMTAAMFADFVLDILEYLETLPFGTFLGVTPFDAGPSLPVTAPLDHRHAVAGLLCVLRQSQMVSEDIHYVTLLKFVKTLPLVEGNRQVVEALEMRLHAAVLPSELQVETAFVHDREGARCKTLSASPRFVAGLYLYGRLVHRKAHKRRLLGALVKEYGNQFVFEYSGKYAEGTAWLYVALAAVWMAHTLGEVHPPYNATGGWYGYRPPTLTALQGFLAPYAEDLNEKAELAWSAPF